MLCFFACLATIILITIATASAAAAQSTRTIVEIQMIADCMHTFAQDLEYVIVISDISQTQIMIRVLEPLGHNVPTIVIVFREHFAKIMQSVRAKKSTPICRMISGLVTVSYKSSTLFLPIDNLQRRLCETLL